MASTPLRSDIVLDAPTEPYTGSGPPPPKFKSANITEAFKEIPVVDYSLVSTDLSKFMDQLLYATKDVGFMLLKNVPGFEQEWQEKVLGEGHKVGFDGDGIGRREGARADSRN